MAITNFSKPNTTTNSTIESGIKFMGHIMQYVEDIAITATGGMTNSARTSIYVTWDTISTTWATETRIWTATGSTFSNSSKSSITEIYDSTNGDTAWNTITPYTISTQSFLSTGGLLDTVYFYLERQSYSSTGQIYAVIYSHSGTLGVSSVPTGSPLAISEPVSVTALSLPTGHRWIPFSFSGANRINLTAGTPYCIGYLYDAGAAIGTLIDNSSPSHPGNLSEWDGATWTAYPGSDLPFKLATLSGISNSPRPV